MGDIPPFDDPDRIIDFFENMLPPCEKPIRYLLCIVGRSTGLMSLERTDGEGSTDTESEIDDTTDTESPTETDDTGEADSEIEEEEGLTIDDLSEGAKNAGKNAGSCYFRYCI